MTLHCHGYLVLQNWRFSRAWLETCKKFIRYLSSRVSAQPWLQWITIPFPSDAVNDQSLCAFGVTTSALKLFVRTLHVIQWVARSVTVQYIQSANTPYLHTEYRCPLLCIQGVPSSHPRPETSYPVFLSVPLRRCQANTSNYPRPLLPHCFNSWFTIRLQILRYMIWLSGPHRKIRVNNHYLYNLLTVNSQVFFINRIHHVTWRPCLFVCLTLRPCRRCSVQVGTFVRMTVSLTNLPMSQTTWRRKIVWYWIVNGKGCWRKRSCYSLCYYCNIFVQEVRKPRKTESRLSVFRRNF
jgi:hypothetical protein